MMKVASLQGHMSSFNHILAYICISQAWLVPSAIEVSKDFSLISVFRYGSTSRRRIVKVEAEASTKKT